MSKRLITLKLGGAMYPQSSNWTTTESTVQFTNWPIEETNIHLGTYGTDFTFISDMEVPFIGTAKAEHTIGVKISMRHNGQLKYWKGTTGLTLVGFEDLIGDGSMQAHLISIINSLNHATYGLNAIRTKVEANGTLITGVGNTASAIKTQTDKLNDSTIGLNAIKTAVNTAITNIATVDAVVDSIKALAEHSTNGLSAIKSKLDTVGTNVTSVSSALAVTDGVVDAIKAMLENASYGLNAIKNITSGTDTNVTLAKSAIDNTYSSLTNATYGLAALKVMLDELSSTSNSEMISAILNRLARIHFVLVGTNF